MSLLILSLGDAIGHQHQQVSRGNAPAASALPHRSRSSRSGTGIPAVLPRPPCAPAHWPELSFLPSPDCRQTCASTVRSSVSQRYPLLAHLPRVESRAPASASRPAIEQVHRDLHRPYPFRMIFDAEVQVAAPPRAKRLEDLRQAGDFCQHRLAAFPRRTDPPAKPPPCPGAPPSAR
jgi:hypothetical protein